METIYLRAANLGQSYDQAKQCVMALGFFDGLHNGHREVIQTAKQIAKEKNLSFAVMSFFPHPKEILSNGKKNVNYLMPMSEKKKLLEKLGVDTFFVIDFTKEFAALSPEQFVANYLNNLGVVHAVAGFDFTYGYMGEGNMNRLNKDSGGVIEVTKVAKVENKGEKISSTKIRELLLDGDVENLPYYMGRYYEIECEWNGLSYKPKHYYMLPAPGQYYVNIKSGSTILPADVHVTEKDMSVVDVTSLNVKLKDEISIMWLNKKLGVLAY